MNLHYSIILHPFCIILFLYKIILLRNSHEDNNNNNNSDKCGFIDTFNRNTKLQCTYISMYININI